MKRLIASAIALTVVAAPALAATAPAKNTTTTKPFGADPHKLIV